MRFVSTEQCDLQCAGVASVLGGNRSTSMSNGHLAHLMRRFLLARVFFTFRSVTPLLLFRCPTSGYDHNHPPWRLRPRKPFNLAPTCVISFGVYLFSSEYLVVVCSWLVFDAVCFYRAIQAPAGGDCICSGRQSLHIHVERTSCSSRAPFLLARVLFTIRSMTPPISFRCPRL